MSCEAILNDGFAHVRGTFQDAETKAFTDPTQVDFYWITPTDWASTATPGPISGHLTYSTSTGDPEIVRVSTGIYYVDLNATEEGRWRYKWSASGTVNGTFEGTYEVGESAFAGRST